MTVNMHVKHARFIEEEVIVQGSDVESRVEQRRHNRIHFVLQQDEISHQDLIAVRGFGHCYPSAETERRGSFDTGNRDLDVISRDVYFQDLILEVTLFAQCGQHLLVIRRYLLSR